MAAIQSIKVYSGASGLVLPVPNKLAYPPEYQSKSRLTYYASLFNSIEVNSSFYKIPQPATIQKWVQSVPEHFRFTFKLWRGITHNKELVFDPQDVKRFIDAVSSAGEKKGCLLVQFPPSVTIVCEARLRALLSAIASADPEHQWKVALEFRHRSWHNEDVYQLAEEFKASIVLQDLPASATPLPDELSEYVYLRFHGPAGGYRGSYQDDFLHEFAGYVKEWSAEGKEVYVYFNNTMGNAVNNLITFNRFLSEQY